MREERRENADRTMRGDTRLGREQRDPSTPRKRVLSSLISLPVLAAVVALASCDPGTTRPDLTPFPEARTIEVMGDRVAALNFLQHALTSDSIPVATLSTRDHWLESPWFDAQTLAPASEERLGTGVVKLRGWADPSRVGATILTVELVYRPMADPSLPWRELERPVPAGEPVYQRVGAALKMVEDSIGAHFGGKPRR